MAFQPWKKNETIDPASSQQLYVREVSRPRKAVAHDALNIDVLALRRTPELEKDELPAAA
jgi:hypothetical protein